MPHTNSMFKAHLRWRGFTLIELLVVMAIIGILAALVVVRIDHALARSRNSKAQSDLAEGGKTISAYLADNGVVLAAVNGSPGAGVAFGGSSQAATSFFGIEKAEAAAGPPPTSTPSPPALHGDIYDGTACGPFSVLFTYNKTSHFYQTPLIPPSTGYMYAYRTVDNKALATGCVGTPNGNNYHQDSAGQTYTLLTSLDTSDGSADAYFWLNNGSAGKGPATSIPAP